MKRVGHVAVFVTDINRSRNFYEEVIGLKHSETHGPEDHKMNKDLGYTLCFMSCGEFHHDLVLVHEQDKNGNTVPVEGHGLQHIAFRLEDGRSTSDFAEELEAKGIAIIYGPVLHRPISEGGDGTWGGNHAVYFHDPDGRRPPRSSRGRRPSYTSESLLSC